MESGEPPHVALFFVLAYLPLHELLLMSQVCKPFRDAISNDVLIWIDIIVERPLYLCLTDETLISITSKAHGRLQTLALLSCAKITDDGLLCRVVVENPLITKLYLPGCTGLTPEGMMKAVKRLTETKPNILTRLKINGIYNLKQEHLLTLHSYLPKIAARKARFYHKYNTFSFHSLDEDDSPIDVETCSRCKDIKLVFDCPREECEEMRQRGRTQCQACLHCIPRCEGCGKCIVDDDELGETICNDTVCLECWLLLPKCNLCNKPFCHRHIDKQANPTCSGESGGFVCDICQEKLF